MLRTFAKRTCQWRMSNDEDAYHRKAAFVATSRAQGLAVAALPKSSGTLCQPLRYSHQRRACKLAALKQQALKDPLALRSSGDDSKAARRRPTIALDTSPRVSGKSLSIQT